MMITISICQRGYCRARPFAEVGVIAIRFDDPVVPAQFFEADVQRLPAALAGGGSALQGSSSSPLASVFGVEDQEWSVFLVEGEGGAA